VTASERGAAVTAIAYYLPQYHRVRENDEWWGAGFTEWTNVARARPLFPGHYQPHIPGELGFYDLRVAETRQAQADLARDHGVAAFCYYHYWFGAEVRLLERPFTEVVASGEPDFPFCLAWANQTWSGISHGAPDRVLIEQSYPGETDDRRHFAALEAAFHDRRYVTVDGKPLFMVYRPQDLPEAERFCELWRELAVASGLPGLFLVGRSNGEWFPNRHGFDATVTSQVTPPFRNRLANDPGARRRLDWIIGSSTRRSKVVPAIYSYAKWAPHIPCLIADGGLSFPTVVPCWDNTPRSGRAGTVYHGSTPALFAEQLALAIDLVRNQDAEPQIVFVQAWNEWAEGNCLEPDLRFGRRYLEAIRDTIGTTLPVVERSRLGDGA
jgi:lipopolysaccharide biosynthesis protein